MHTEDVGDIVMNPNVDIYTIGEERCIPKHELFGMSVLDYCLRIDLKIPEKKGD